LPPYESDICGVGNPLSAQSLRSPSEVWQIGLSRTGRAALNSPGGQGRQRLPPHDHTQASPGGGIILDPGEVSPEFDCGGQFATSLEHLTDPRGRRLVDAEHGASMGGGTATDKRMLASG
jgi:hypothetical protein